MQQHYEPIRRNHTTTPVIVQRMDACGTLTDEMFELIKKTSREHRRDIL